MIFDRRDFLAGAAALALASCTKGEGGRTKLVMGDQVQLIRSRLEAADALSGLSYDIAWTNFAGAAPLLEALNAGAVDTAVAGDLPVILAASAGVPLKLVAALPSSPEDIAIIVPPGSSVRRLTDLRGKRVIVSTARGSIADYLWMEAAREAGLDAQAVSTGYMLPNDAASAFAAGQIDAWATFGIYQAVAESRGARVIRDGRGINSGLGMIAVSQAALDDPGKHKAIADILSRLRRANDWSRAHPDAYADIFAQRTKVPREIARAIVKRQNPPLVAINDSIIATLQHVSDRFFADGGLPHRVAIAPLVDRTLLSK